MNKYIVQDSDGNIIHKIKAQGLRHAIAKTEEIILSGRNMDKWVPPWTNSKVVIKNDQRGEAVVWFSRPPAVGTSSSFKAFISRIQ